MITVLCLKVIDNFGEKINGRYEKYPSNRAFETLPANILAYLCLKKKKKCLIDMDLCQKGLVSSHILLIDIPWRTIFNFLLKKTFKYIYIANHFEEPWKLVFRNKVKIQNWLPNKFMK